MTAVLLDAMGTLVELEAPAPRLVAALGRRGVEVGEADARAALRREIAFYRAHHDAASTRAGLVALRAACTEELRAALPPAARAVQDLQGALLEALAFRPYSEVPAALGALRDAGARLVVVSNWDVSLHDVLASTGLAPLVDGAVTSAEHGAAKPAASIFAAGLTVAGEPADAALHVGDALDADVAGARAAGIEPVLVARDGAAAPAGVRAIASLAELPAVVRDYLG